MDFFEVVDKRFSARKYLKKDVEKRLIDMVIETSKKAPSAGNLKAYKILVVTKQRTKEEISKAAYNQSFVSEAPALLIFCALPSKSASVYGKRGAELYSIQDATIAASYAQLAATALGLATCWVGAFNEDRVKEILGLRDDKPIAIMPLGFADEKRLKKK
ncbi:MAG: nitroreductase family protein [Candidatus Diapherotrites archaeon]